MDMSGLGLEIESISFLAKLITDVFNITHLSVAKCNIGNIGVIILGKAL